MNRKLVMHKIRLKRSLAVCTVAMTLLTGCGGGDDDNDRVPGSEVTASALQSVAGLIAYLQDLIVNATNGTGEPVVLGDITLPTSETSEPAALQ